MNTHLNQRAVVVFGMLAFGLSGCGQPMNSVPNGIVTPAPVPAAGSGAISQTQPGAWANPGTWGNNPAGPIANGGGSGQTGLTGFQNQFDQSAQKFPNAGTQVQQTYAQVLNWSGRFYTQIALQTQAGWIVQDAGLMFQAARDGSVAFTVETRGQISFVFQGNLVPVQATQQLGSNLVLAAHAPRPLAVAGRNQVTLLVGVPDGDLSRAEMSFRDCGAAQDCSAELPIYFRPGLTAY